MRHFFSFLFAGFLLLICHSDIRHVEATAFGEVKCTLNVQWSDRIFSAHETCLKKIKEEKKDDTKKSGTTEEHKEFPYNATLEEFDFDDNCLDHCLYKTLGVLTNDDLLPDKKETTKFFSRGKLLSPDRYSKLTTTWDTCLDLTAKIATGKKFDKCKTVSLHDFCFFKKLREVYENLEVDC